MNRVEDLSLSTGEEMAYVTTNSSVSESVSDVLNPVEIYDNRLSTCMKCQYVTAERMCTECGCPVVMMAQFNFKQCPKGFW